MEIGLDGSIDGHLDPLAGRPGALSELLMELDDRDVLRFLDYWRARHELRDEEGNFQGTWWAERHIAAGEREIDRRGGVRTLTDMAMVAHTR